MFKKDPPSNFTAGSQKDGDFYVWQAAIFGPTESNYEGREFKLKITFPMNYPFKPPKIVVITRIYHTNNNAQGAICLNILKN